MSARLRGFTANLTMMKMRVTGWQGICGVRQRPILSSAARCSSDVYGALCWPRCARMMKGKPGFTAGLGSAGDESWKIKGKVQREREARYEKKDSINSRCAGMHGCLRRDGLRLERQWQRWLSERQHIQK